MKRALAWFAGLVGIAALGRWLAARSNRRASPSAPAPESEAAAGATADDPAEELRRKLAEARDTPTDASTDADEGEAPAEETLEERRARVHAKAREAIDAMGDDGGAG